jgi:hypothetical protein
MASEKSLSFIYHSGPDKACPVLDTGESSVSELDSRWSLHRTSYGAAMTVSKVM